MKKRKNEQGAAMIVVIIVIMVLVMFSMSLMLISYSFFKTASSQDDWAQCRELAESLSVSLQDEITGTYNDTIENDNSLWYYLRKNVWESSWPYYNEDERGHTSAFSDRYFDLKTNSSDADANAIADDVSVRMFWKSEKNTTDRSGTELVVAVTVTKGDQKCTISTIYELNVSKSGQNAGNTESTESTESTDNKVNDATVDKADEGVQENNNDTSGDDKENEHWEWSFSYRE